MSARKSQHRVKQYRRQFGEESPELVLFGEAQARSVGAVLEPDGIALDRAVLLVDTWNRQGARHGYKYSIPFLRSNGG